MFKKNLNASKPSEHPPQVEECLKVKVGTLAVETKPLHGFKRVPQCNYHRVESIISGRSPPLYCTLKLISTQGYQSHNPFYLRVLDYEIQGNNMILYGLGKLK